MKVVVVLGVGLGAWTSSEAQSLTWLGVLPESYTSQAWGVSADGRVVVGWSSGRAFRWENGVMQDLGTLGGAESIAYGVSADGRVVVGQARYAGRSHAFRWENGVIQDLGALGGAFSEARGVSADGRVVVGWASDASDNWGRAFRWTAETGMQNLNQVFASLLSPGSILFEASAISPDGRYIVGWGYNAAAGRTEGFLLDTWRTGDTNGDGCINNADLLAVLFAFGTPGTSPTYHEDINRDGVVDNADLLEVLFNFGQGC